MPKFSIIPKGGGAARYSGTPTYTGTYMKTGVLEFREIASPTPIPFSVGDYVVYSRTGRTYRLYELPQVKKQAANSKYGGGYLYQNVQFKDDSYQLEICPFRDLVVGDNRVHFSTQPAISVWDDVAGIAERIQACLDDMYGSGAWAIRLATTSEGLDPDLATLMTDERDFSVSGVSCLGVLAKIYEVWPNIGWVYKVEGGVNTIVIGGAGLNVAQSSSYGKGNGLLSITRNVANADQLANRLYVYGSSRNMLSKWYSQFAIKDAQSVDIQNLMLPIERPGDVPAAQYGGWGKSDDGGVMKPDPAKAFVEDAALAAANLRPKTVYFDGSEDLKEIYPTISGMTIADVIRAKSDYGDTDYVPDISIYTDTSVRVDQVLAVLSTFDSGLAAAAGKSAYTLNYGTYAHSGQSVSVPAGQTLTRQIFRDEFSVSPGRSDFLAEFPAFGLIGGGQAAYLDFTLERKHSGSYEQFFTQRVQLNNGDAGSRSIGAGSIKCDNNEMVFTSGDKVRITMSLVLDNTSGTSAASGLLSNASGTLTYGAKVHRDKTFQIRLRQLGFNIQEQAALGDGKSIAFTSGRCAGRSFNIQACVYESDTDTWLLDVWRSEDESLAQYFPNADYPIAAGDEFVLLEIAMPAIYVHVAEHRLLDAALELLADTKVEQWQYTPEIDAKFMVENSRTINAGEVIGLTDADVVVDAGPFLVDSVSINEGDAEIPTYKVTLRERKKKSYTDTGGAVSSNSRSVGGSTDDDELANIYSLLHFKADKSALMGYLKKDDYHFEDDPDFEDEAALKAAYGGLRIPGLRFGEGREDFDLEVRNVAAEGDTPVYALYTPLPLITGGDQILGSGTPGGGEPTGVSYLHELLDVDISDPTNGQILSYDGTLQKWVNADAPEDSVQSVAGVGPDEDGDVDADALKDALGLKSAAYREEGYFARASHSHGISDITGLDGNLSTISSALQSLQAQIDSVATRDSFDELTASSAFVNMLAADDVYANRYHFTQDIFFSFELIDGVPAVRLNAALITAGDQVLGNGTPGGGGGGGGSSYLYELLDVDDDLNAPAVGTLLQWYGGEWVGTVFSNIENGDLLTYAAGKWSNVPRTSVGIVTDATHAAHGLMSAADKTKLDSIDTTDIAHGETAYQALDVIGPALQSLQAQIDSVATKTNFDELTATAVAADIVAASDIYGALHGNADTASDADKLDGHDSSYFGTASAVSTLQGYFTNGVANNADKLDGIHAVDLFSALGSGAATNLSLTIGGTTRTATLYATYDSASENISDKFGIVSSALQALQGQIDSVASRSDISDFEATTEAKMDYMCDLMRSLQSQIDSVSTRINDGSDAYFDILSVGKAIYGDVLITTGDQTLSDERKKNITREIVLTAEEIASCRAVAFDWKHKPGSSFGSIAQDWQKILPEAVSDSDDELYLFYGQSAAVAVINLAREVMRLKKMLGINN